MAFSRILQDLLEQDKFAKFTKTSDTTATLGSLTLNTAILGAGGLDTGSIAASTLYYVYTIVDSNSIKLIASISSTSPTGFTQYKKVGAFYTDTSSNIFKAYFYGEINQTVFSAYFQSNGTAVGQTPINWVSSSSNSSGSLNINLLPGIFSVEPRLLGNRAGSGGGTVATVATGGNAFSILLSQGNTQLNPHQALIQKAGIDAAQPDWSRI